MPENGCKDQRQGVAMPFCSQCSSTGPCGSRLETELLHEIRPFDRTLAWWKLLPLGAECV